MQMFFKRDSYRYVLFLRFAGSTVPPLYTSDGESARRVEGAELAEGGPMKAPAARRPLHWHALVVH
jgi:hypothetical protein